MEDPRAQRRHRPQRLRDLRQGIRRARRARNRRPVNEQTLFEIGSSSKAFTATLVAMIVSDGKMRWDDQLTDYLPDFRMYDPVANESVTLRDALSHRSGIARGELVVARLGHHARRGAAPRSLPQAGVAVPIASTRIRT